MAMISQHELGRRFGRGDDPEDIPSASNIEVEPGKDNDEYEAVVVGYNWALYAARMSDGSVVVYDGWRGYSNSTTQQIGQVKRGAMQYADVETRDLSPKHRSKSNAERDGDSRYPIGSGYPA